jgi:hypothetical protein
VPAKVEGGGAAGEQSDPQVETLVQQLTDQILKQLAGK